MANIPAFGLGKQSSFGTAASTLNAFKPTQFDGSLDIERIDNEEMFGQLDTFAADQGIVQASVSVSGYAYPTLIGHVLQMAAGAPTTSGVSAPYTHVFKPGNSVPPGYTIGTDEPNGIDVKFLDVRVSDFTLTQDIGAPLMWSIDAISTERVEGAVTISGSPESGRPFRFDDLTVTIDSSSVANFKNLSISISNPIENIFTLNGENTASAQEFTGRRAIEISGTLRFTNDAASYRDEFETNTSMDWELEWALDSDTTLTIHLPDVRIVTHNWNRGFDETVVDFTATAHYSTSDAYAISFTLDNANATY